jgi:WXG100 family type VII secretion target
MSEYTEAHFGKLSVGQQDFIAVHNAVQQTLDDLDGKLKSSLAQWTGDAQAQYHRAKTQWQQAANDMTTVMNRLAGVIGTAHENYTSVEKANAQMW